MSSEDIRHLKVNKLGMRYGNLRLFKDLSFDLYPKTTLAVTGNNGSGKSTLLKILAGVLEPDSGTVTLTNAGVPVPQEQRCLRCGFVAPYLALYDELTLRENLHFLARVRSRSVSPGSIGAILADVGLTHRKDDRVGTFSSGLKQRARFAAALIGEPDLVLLDEPASNLDKEGRRILKNLMGKWYATNRLLVIATNDPEEARACERQISIHDFPPG